MDSRLPEIAAARYWQNLGYQTRRAVRTKYQQQDFFAADIIGKSPMDTVWVQVTMGNANNVRKRKRKLEEQYWNSNDRVFVFELERRQSVEDRRTVKYYFRIHEYHPLSDKTWDIWPQRIEIEPSWFRVSKEQVSIDTNYGIT